MTRLFKSIVRFSKKIWKIIDNKIIIPVTKIVVKTTGQFDTSSKGLERWLSSANVLLYISLFLAAILFIVVDQKVLEFSESSAKVLKGQKVTVKYNEEAYVVEGVPETVDITLIGSSANLYFAQQSPIGEIVVDLSSYGPGTHKVDITYNQAISSISYSINPGTITVNIYQKVSQSKTLSVDVLNKESLDEKLIIEKVTFESDQVVIKGAEKDINKVAAVKALVDVKNIVKQSVGTNVLKDVPLQAYDEKGYVVDVEVVPEKMDVTLEITSPSKEVPIRINPIGKVSFGLAISAITTSHNQVIIYGEEEALNGINYVTVDVDVTDLKGNKTFKLGLPNIVGVKSMSVKNLTVNVNVDKAAEKEFENISIEYKNLKPGLSVQASSGADTSVSVSVVGVQSVLDLLTNENIKAYLNLEGLYAGTHEVTVEVESTENKVSCTPKTAKVKVIIKDK
jgi:YbbR domain-containing protein